MRFCYLVLLSAAFFLAITDAASEQSTTTKTALLDTAQYDQSPITGGNDISSKRFLRTNDISRDAEERTINVIAVIKQFGSKLKRLAIYNKWIFSNKKPKDIRSTYPNYYDGYFKFYANRMIPGGKYA